jgi:PBP1b-binding outer membrane lipoprotein LpoB
VKHFDGDVEVERIFTDTIDLEVDGESVTTQLSDHFGLLATLTPE